MVSSCEPIKNHVFVWFCGSHGCKSYCLQELVVFGACLTQVGVLKFETLDVGSMLIIPQGEEGLGVSFQFNDTVLGMGLWVGVSQLLLPISIQVMWLFSNVSNM